MSRIICELDGFYRVMIPRDGVDRDHGTFVSEEAAQKHWRYIESVVNNISLPASAKLRVEYEFEMRTYGCLPLEKIREMQAVNPGLLRSGPPQLIRLLSEPSTDAGGSITQSETSSPEETYRRIRREESTP